MGVGWIGGGGAHQCPPRLALPVLQPVGFVADDQLEVLPAWVGWGGVGWGGGQVAITSCAHEHTRYTADQLFACIPPPSPRLLVHGRRIDAKDVVGHDGHHGLGGGGSSKVQPPAR